jgi:hypothetical protein
MSIKNIKENKKSTEANTTLKDKLKNIKNKKYSSFTGQDDIPQRMSREPDMSPTLKNFKSGGRVNLKGGGCAQIKGFGKARKPKKKYG